MRPETTDRQSSSFDHTGQWPRGTVERACQTFLGKAKFPSLSAKSFGRAGPLFPTRPGHCAEHVTSYALSPYEKQKTAPRGTVLWENRLTCAAYAAPV